MSCIFCDAFIEDGQPTVVLRQKGCDAINALAHTLGLTFTVIPGQTVHTVCRRDFCRQKELRRSKNPDQNLSEEYRRLRSGGGFDFEKHCLFCGQVGKTSGNKRGFDVFPVRTFDFQNKIRQQSLNRDDEWGNQVLARLGYAHDLPAADALYHQTCSVNFRTGRQKPISKQTESEIPIKSPKGRPENQRQSEAFLTVTQRLEENDDEQTSINDLVKQMDDLYPDHAYSAVYMKKKLMEEFNDQIVITEINGIPNIVT